MVGRALGIAVVLNNSAVVGSTFDAKVGAEVRTLLGRALGTLLGIPLRILLEHLLSLINKMLLGRALGLFERTLFFHHTFSMAATETNSIMEFILFSFASVVFALSTSFVIC